MTSVSTPTYSPLEEVLSAGGARGEKKRIVVVGAGFGGLKFCEEMRHPDVEITLVDRQNHHLFQPLLYQVATAGLAAPDIAQPIRSILEKRSDITVILDEVTDVNLEQKVVICRRERLEYDYLVLAVGAVTSYFNHPEWEKDAAGLKSIDDAFKIRRRVLLSFELAETEADPDEQARLMTMVIIGGGATGVELAGAFSELSQFVLAKDFRRIDPRKARIILIEGGPYLLPAYPVALCEKAKESLEKFGVEVRVHTKVRNVKHDEVELDDGEVIRAGTIVWAAGVAANPLGERLGVPLAKGGRVVVKSDLSLPGHPHVFAIGDLISIEDQKTGKPVPGLAQAAIQMGEYVAKLIGSEIDKRGCEARTNAPFVYRDRGTMATIGRKSAVAEIGKVQLTGFLAWIMWLIVHVIMLIGFRNKVSVLLEWMYSYITYNRAARVITGIKHGGGDG